MLLSAVLILILLGSAALQGVDTVPNRFVASALALGLYATSAAWPVFVTLIVVLVTATTFEITRVKIERWRWMIIVIGAATVVWAWSEGIRRPLTHEGIFVGEYILSPLNFEPDLFLPCEEGKYGLPRGAELGHGALGGIEVPIMAAVDVPNSGWHGVRPTEWPDTFSDSHGAQYFFVRMKGKMIGPGNYGSPPYAHYKFQVDSVLSTSPRLSVDPSDCRSLLQAE
jgi:hypothetical protein